VYRISKVSQSAQPDQARRKQEADQITQVLGQQEMYGYIEALKQKAKAKVTVKAADLGANKGE
jgi:peptidyl-prolyl cis-trans isomerase D